MKKLAIVLLAGAVAPACGGESDPPNTDVTVDPSNVGGFQWESPIFEVPEGEEIQDCYFVQMPDLDGDGTDVWFDKIRIGVNGGSHHTNIFRVRTISGLDPADGFVHNGECFKSSNWADWPLVANNQLSGGGDYYTWELPTDVGFRIPVGEWLMIQTHYVNAATQDTPFRGKVAIDFYRTPTPPTNELGTMFATQQSIRVCQGDQDVQFHGTCRFPSGVNVSIGAANGHFHSRGKQFEMFRWDGLAVTRPPMTERFYESTSWDEPPMATYGAGQWQVPDGGGIWWTCTYDWTPPSVGCDTLNDLDPEQEGNCCYTFGPKVEQNEHCNVFLYYWPAVDRSSIFCN